jgi:hypothetical protein
MSSGENRELVLAAFSSVCVAMLQWWPMLQAPAATGFGDWQMVHHNWEAAYVALSRFGEWPLWDPFHCGGVPILGNPESQLYAPWFWLSFALGTVLAVKVMLLGHITCAALGMYWLCRRRYQLQLPGAALAAVAWSCCGCFAWDAAGGHATFLSFAFAPWLSYFIHRGRDLVREAAAVAGLLLLTLLEGGTYPLPFFLIWIGFELCVRTAWTSSAKLAAIILGLLGLAGAIRFVPIYLSLRAYPRQVPNRDALSLSDVWTMLTAREHPWRMPNHPFVWAEYGSYVGVVVVLLAGAGLAVVLRKRLWHLLLGLGLYSVIMLGNFSDFAPYSLLHRLPVYDSLRVPSRFAIFVTFYLALLAAHALDAGMTLLRRPRAAAAAGALLALGIGTDIVCVGWTQASKWTGAPLSEAAPAAEFHLVARNYKGYASYPRLNVGTNVCYVGGMNWPVSRALWIGQQPQVRVPSDAGELHRWERTPNTVRADLTLQAPARVLLNQNYARGFSSNLATPLSADGLVAVDLPAGHHALTVTYRPPELLPSAAVSGIGILLLLWLLLRSRHGLPRSPN